MISVSPPYNILWSVDPFDRVAVGFNSRFDLTVYGPDLRPELRFIRDYELLKNPYYSGKSWQNEFYPAYEKIFLLADDDGNFWLDRALPPVQGKGESEGAKAEWVRPPEHIYDIFSPGGIYIREVTLSFRIQCIRGGKYYSLVRDEDGYSRVKRFRLEG